MLWRDDSVAPAYLEYSWVPTGKRKDISLADKQDEGARTDAVDTDISHVQVYRLDIHGIGVANWQFPPGPPGPYPVIYAAIEVFTRRNSFRSRESLACVTWMPRRPNTSHNSCWLGRGPSCASSTISCCLASFMVTNNYAIVCINMQSWEQQCQ